MKKIQASYHMLYAFNYASRDIIIKTIIEALTPKLKEFDSVVVSGYSMALIGSIVAHELKKNIVLVRKAGDDAHSDYITEGLHKQRCVFIDDLVATGNTLRYVADHLKKIKGTIVGIVLYHDYDECYEGESVVNSWDNKAIKMDQFPIWERFDIGTMT